MDRRAVKAGVSAAMIVALSIAVTLTSCASSPKTTYRAENVNAVIVEWDAYPGHAGMDAGDVLRTLPAEEIGAVSARTGAAVNDTTVVSGAFIDVGAIYSWAGTTKTFRVVPDDLSAYEFGVVFR